MKIVNVLDLLRILKEEKKLKIRFRKKNNEIRVMNCTINKELIPKEKLGKTKIDLKSIKNQIKRKQLVVFDIDKGDWRTVSLPVEKI